MGKLPQKLPVDQMQTQWASQIDPILNNPLNTASILPNISLKSGVNVINTKLGRMQQGWVIVDKQGVADIYRSAPYNDLTLTLTSSAPVIVSLEVF